MTVQPIPPQVFRETADFSPSPPTELGERAGVRWRVAVCKDLVCRGKTTPLAPGDEN
jgi:hypothetical protein